MLSSENKKRFTLIVLFLSLVSITYFLMNYDFWIDFNRHYEMISSFETQGFYLFNETYGGYPVFLHFIAYIFSGLIGTQASLAVLSSLCFLLFVFSIYRYISMKFNTERGILSVVITMAFTLALYFHFMGTFPFFFAIGCLFLALPHIEEKGFLHWIPVLSLIMIFLSHRLLLMIFLISVMFYGIKQRRITDIVTPVLLTGLIFLFIPVSYLQSALKYTIFNIVLPNEYRIFVFVGMFFIYNLFVLKGCIRQYREKRLDVFFLIAMLICGAFEIFSPFFFTRFQLGYIVFGLPFVMENIELLERNMNVYTASLLSLPVSTVWGFMFLRIISWSV